MTRVILPNGGEIHYTYTNNNLVRSVTDQNGHTYVTTEYDHRGRATKQVLATGEEYIIYYDDRNKRNTFIYDGNEVVVTETEYVDLIESNKQF